MFGLLPVGAAVLTMLIKTGTLSLSQLLIVWEA
jgi:hypothetical protein